MHTITCALLSELGGTADEEADGSASRKVTKDGKPEYVSRRGRKALVDLRTLFPEEVCKT